MQNKAHMKSLFQTYPPQNLKIYHMKKRIDYLKIYFLQFRCAISNIIISQSENQRSMQNQYQAHENNQHQQGAEMIQREQDKGSVLLYEKIDSLIESAEDGKKLTWAALSNLYEQQNILSKKMQEEISKIEQKYNEMQISIVQKMSQVIAGQQMQSSLYNIKGIKNINTRKTKPKAIPGYWLRIIQKSKLGSLMDDQDQDAKILKLCKKINLKIEQETQHVIFSMQFGQNNYFKNTKLEIQFKFEDGTTLSRKTPYKIQYLGKKRQDSIFTILFENDNCDQMVFDMLLDFHNMFSNSLKIYFLGETSLEQQRSNQEHSQQGEKPRKKIKPNEQNVEDIQ